MKTHHSKIILIVITALQLTFKGVGGLFAGQWNHLNTTGSVPHLKNASAIYEPSGNRMIVYGGRTAIGVAGELWSLNLATNQWSQIVPAGGPNPAPRYTQNAYYDPVTSSMIIWSGQGDAANLMNDVWIFSFSTNMWSELWPDSNVSGAPLKRYGTSSVFDPVTRKITTFAGFTTSGRFEDTWTFDVSNMSWADRTNTPHPPKRCLHSGVYANDLGKFVIYGGQDTGPLDDIWQCTLSNFAWADITPQLKPPARFWNSIIYTGSGNIVIFGGLGSVPLGDMWKFSMSNNMWEIVNQGVTIPAARWGHTGIFVPATDKLIIFGGEGAANYTDTWEFTGASAIGIDPISSNIPQEFSLMQNYPNPFNPNTKIKFNIPANVKRESANVKRESANVKLIVYDILGHRVRELVNQKLSAGSYEVEFPAGSLPSGVYFYTLSAQGFSQTKRMVLIK